MAIKYKYIQQFIMQIKYYDPVTFNPSKQPTFHIGNVCIIVEQISRKNNIQKIGSSY